MWFSREITWPKWPSWYPPSLVRYRSKNARMSSKESCPILFKDLRLKFHMHKISIRLGLLYHDDCSSLSWFQARFGNACIKPAIYPMIFATRTVASIETLTLKCRSLPSLTSLPRLLTVYVSTLAPYALNMNAEEV